MPIPKIVRAWSVAGLGGYYCADKQAIIQGARRDGLAYEGSPLTPGFRSIREPGEALLVTLQAEDGSLGEGDCVSVTYAGGAGRDPLFHTAEYLEPVNERVLPRLMGRSWPRFRDAAADLKLLYKDPPLHLAIEYGLSQALLGLAAAADRCTVAEVVCHEYGLPLPRRPVPVGIQTGDDRYLGADKAVLKRADALPHASVKSEDDLGTRGERLLEYGRWLRDRIAHLAGPDYRPIIHFDLYGSLGRAFDHDVAKMADFLLELERTVQPYDLQIETPVEMDSQAAQIAKMAQLCRALEAAGSKVQIIADEWCNTLEDTRLFVAARACHIVQVKMPDLGSVADSIEAVLCCKTNGIGAYLGGSCNETVLSAQVSADIALATQADRILAKPGMGVDEALMVIRNQMARTLGRMRARGL